MKNTNLLFFHWCLKWSPGKTGRKTLSKLNNVVLNTPETAGGKIKLNYISNGKQIPYEKYGSPKMGAREIITIVNLQRIE